MTTPICVAPQRGGPMNIVHSGFSIFTPGKKAVPVGLEMAGRLGLSDTQCLDAGSEDSADLREYLLEHDQET
ncbi:MAG: hypothetical protein AAB483_00460 [Patescibacteria group bacterium]